MNTNPRCVTSASVTRSPHQEACSARRTASGPRPAHRARLTQPLTRASRSRGRKRERRGRGAANARAYIPASPLPLALSVAAAPSLSLSCPTRAVLLPPTPFYRSLFLARLARGVKLLRGYISSLFFFFSSSENGNLGKANETPSWFPSLSSFLSIVLFLSLLPSLPPRLSNSPSTTSRPAARSINRFSSR